MLSSDFLSKRKVDHVYRLSPIDISIQIDELKANRQRNTDHKMDFGDLLRYAKKNSDAVTKEVVGIMQMSSSSIA